MSKPDISFAHYAADHTLTLVKAETSDWKDIHFSWGSLYGLWTFNFQECSRGCLPVSLPT